MPDAEFILRADHTIPQTTQKQRQIIDSAHRGLTPSGTWTEPMLHHYLAKASNWLAHLLARFDNRPTFNINQCIKKLLPVDHKFNAVA